MTDANADGIINYQNFPFATDGAGEFVNSYEYLNVSTDPKVIAQGLTAGKPAEIQALSNQIENAAQHCGTIGNPNNNAYRILFYEADDIKALAANNSTWATDIGTYVDSILCAAFVFPEGVEMATDFISPATRGFIFLHEDTPTVLTADAWAIFDAMVKWLIEGPVTVGVNDIANDFKVYPTRVKDNIEINLIADQAKSNTQVSVYNVTGSLILAQEFSGSNKISVNLSNLNQGVYVIKIQNQSTITSYRIIKE